jgi:hypothetical protein
MIKQVKDISIGTSNNYGGIYVINEASIFELNKMLADGVHPIIMIPNTKCNEDNTIDTFPIMVILDEIELEETIDTPDNKCCNQHLVSVKGIALNSWNIVNKTINIGAGIQGYLAYPLHKDIMTPDNITAEHTIIYKDEITEYIIFPLVGHIRPLEYDDNDNIEENDNKNDDK